MDALDREILALLQRDGRATMTELADKVGLSLSACHRRFKALQSAGVLRRFRAEFDLEQLGLPFEAMVFVTLMTGDHTAMSDFENAIVKIPNIVQAHRLFGDIDYLIYVVARSKQDFQRLYDEQLTVIPGIQRLTSTLIMKTLVEHHTPL